MSVIAGAAVGSVVGGLTNTAIGNGTFGEGARIGAVAGGLGGLVGSIGLYGSRQEFWSFGNYLVKPIVQPISKLLGAKPDLFPLGLNAALTATLGMAGFLYDQLKKPCNAGYSYDWKTNKCQPSIVAIPIPTPRL